MSFFGYGMANDFDRVVIKDKHPMMYWYRAEDDGLEKYYYFKTSTGPQYLLSNNMNHKDRTEFYRLYQAHSRSHYLSHAAGLWLAAETVLRAPYFRGMAVGWKFVSWFGIGAFYCELFNWRNAQQYQPLLGAYLRKYQDKITPDLWEVRDRKREYYEIDTSQYMNYTLEDADEHCHINMGPQPDGENRDSSWLVELDKFLAGKENHLKEHHRYVNHEYEFIDKTFPTKDAANELIRGAAPKRN